MDKLIQRTRMAERQAARKLLKAQAVRKRDKRIEAQNEQKQNRKEVGMHLRAAIRTRHEDWKLGPLAPSRHASVVRGGRHWGSIGPGRARSSYDLLEDDLEARCAWAGGSRHLCLTKGDRVAVVEGWLKGKIAVVKEVHKSVGAVDLGDIAKSNVTLPEFMLPEEAKGQTVQTMETYVPISAVRLVHPIHDEATNTTRDVVIRELRPQGVSYDKPTRRVSWSRVVPGANIEIPWPRVQPPRHTDHAFDTLRIDVEERSFVPTLLRPPIPETAIDELRGRYSKFRTRHTDEYVAQKEAEAAAKKAARRGAAEAMKTPLQEFNRRRRDERRALGQPVLSDEMLEKIGEVMMRNGKRMKGGIGEIEARLGGISLGETTATGENRPNAS